VAQHVRFVQRSGAQAVQAVTDVLDVHDAHSPRAAAWWRKWSSMKVAMKW
jgi:hypothetical protein